jgi:hypothetical protein
VRIQNTTQWRTDDLRRIFKAALKAEGLTEREAGRYIKVQARKYGVRGWATLNGDWISMLVRNPLPGEECMPSALLDTFAQVFVHEAGHNAGLEHREMMDSDDITVPWIVGMEVRLQAAKVKPKRDLQAERRAKAEKKLAEWEKTQARAAKRVKHWRAKVRYYERAAEKKAALKQ